MIKKGLKNYFVNLKYYFTPLGMLALGVILGLAVAIPVMKSSIRELVDYVSSLNNVQLDFKAFLDNVLDAVLGLDWKNPAKAITTVFSSDWLNETFMNSISALVHDVEPVAEQIVEKVSSCVGSIVFAAIAVIVFAVVGVIGGYFLTKYLVRKEIAKRAFWKFFLVSLLDALITAAFPLLSVYMSQLWKPAAFIVILFFPILWGFVLLLEAYVVQGMGKIKAKEAVNLKNSAKLLLTNLLILLFSSLFTSVITGIGGEFIGMLLGLPFVEIALIVCGLNAESYVKEIAEKKQADGKNEPSQSESDFD